MFQLHLVWSDDVRAELRFVESSEYPQKAVFLIKAKRLDGRLARHLRPSYFDLRERLILVMARECLVREASSALAMWGRMWGRSAMKFGKRQFSGIFEYVYGGQGGIRTHGELAPTAVFKTAALNHSATCPHG
jgi:hypothetical protein